MGRVLITRESVGKDIVMEMIELRYRWTAVLQLCGVATFAVV